jgi:ubiquinone/menaquinone biosynthesis C-methylase UbiE
METNVQSLYNQWAATYDEIENKTRDLDKTATQTVLAELIKPFMNVLEFGCGTGKNTEWLVTRTGNLTAVDFSEKMLGKAKEKLSYPNLLFRQADITKAWPFESNKYDLVTCNLILEHVKDLEVVFAEAARVLKNEGLLFVSELHPAKQYLGSKARFEIDEQTVSPDCFIHHVSDYFSAALTKGFTCIDLKEWFDDKDKALVPRLISFLFKRSNAK